MDGFMLADGLVSPCWFGTYMTLEDRSREIGGPVLQIRNKATAP
jgi:hypothetical protein